jgi:hypothetical protein
LTTTKNCAEFSSRGLSINAKGTLHEVKSFAGSVALFEHERHEEVGHGLGHVDLDASQQEQIGFANRASLVEIDNLVDELLQ